MELIDQTGGSFGKVLESMSGNNLNVKNLGWGTYDLSFPDHQAQPKKPNTLGEGNVSKKADPVLSELKKMSWLKLDRSGKLSQLKATDLKTFKEKFKAHFGTDYKDDTHPNKSQETVSVSNLSLSNDLDRQTWDELDRSGKLSLLKEIAPDIFKRKFKIRFGREYEDQPGK